MRVRSLTELNADELGNLVDYLLADLRGNALLLADLLALPEVCEVRVLQERGRWIVGAVRQDLPFHALAFSTGDEPEYRALIAAFSGCFAPGDVVYSLGPEEQTGTLARAVGVRSITPSVQLFLDLSSGAPPPASLDPLTAQGFTFRRLSSTDLGSVRAIMQACEAFAFAESSFHQGLYWGAFEGDRLVCAVGTHFLAKQAAEVGNLVTLPAYRRRGLARTCLSLLLRDLSERTESAIIFYFAEFDFLHRLYASLGFRDPRRFDLVAWVYPRG